MPDASSSNISVDIHDVPGMDVVDELTTALMEGIDAYIYSEQKIDFLLAIIDRLHPVDREKTTMKKMVRQEPTLGHLRISRMSSVTPAVFSTKR